MVHDYKVVVGVCGNIMASHALTPHKYNELSINKPLGAGEEGIPVSPVGETFKKMEAGIASEPRCDSA